MISVNGANAPEEWLKIHCMYRLKAWKILRCLAICLPVDAKSKRSDEKFCFESHNLTWQWSTLMRNYAFRSFNFGHSLQWLKSIEAVHRPLFILTYNKHVINYSWSMFEGVLSKKRHYKAVLDGCSEELVVEIVIKVVFTTCALMLSQIFKSCCDSWRSSTGEHFFAAFKDVFTKGRNIQVNAQVAQAHSERSAYNNLLIFAYFISRQNIRVCMENATKTL